MRAVSIGYNVLHIRVKCCISDAAINNVTNGIYQWWMSFICDECHLRAMNVIYLWRMWFTCDERDLPVTNVIYLW